LDRGLCVSFRLHLHEGKPACAAGHLVAHDVDGVDGTDRLKQLFETTLISVEGKIANKQLTTHDDSCPFQGVKTTAVDTLAGSRELGRLATTVQREAYIRPVYSPAGCKASP